MQVDAIKNVTQVKTEKPINDLGLGNSESEILKLKKECEESKNQIDFLNSVIVDLQKKNDKMKVKVEVMEMGIPSNEADDYNL